MVRLRAVVHDERMNALISWMLTGIVILTAVESFLTAAFLWGGVALLVVVVIAVPAVVTGEWTVMVPWPLPLVATTAMIVRALGIYVEIAGYFAVVALALIVVIELDAATSWTIWSDMARMPTKAVTQSSRERAMQATYKHRESARLVQK